MALDVSDLRHILRLLQLAYITPDKKYTTYIKGVTKMAQIYLNITIEKYNRRY